MKWPTVQADDDGIRPAGKPDECFYCRQKVGQEHARDCVTIEKRVRLRYVFEVDVNVPHHWDKESIEFHRNESTWCADNAIDQLTDEAEKPRGGESCWCPRFRAELVTVLDETPIQKRRDGSEEYHIGRSPRKSGGATGRPRS